MKSTNNYDKWWMIVITGYLLTVSMAVTMGYTFLRAYFTPEHSTLVKINTYGEMQWEFFLLVFVTIMSISGLIGLYKIRNRRNTT
jgi:succinate dehydrogenase hydrophobic anchor subunit